MAARGSKIINVQKIHNPKIPHISAINDGLVPGKILRIQGIAYGATFNINLQCGPFFSPKIDIALQLSIHPSEGYIGRNTLIAQHWGKEESHGKNPIGPKKRFEIVILTDLQNFKIAINGKPFCEFIHRMPLNRITHLTIVGDVKVKLIGYEHHEMEEDPEIKQFLGQVVAAAGVLTAANALSESGKGTSQQQSEAPPEQPSKAPSKEPRAITDSSSSSKEGSGESDLELDFIFF